MKLQRRPRRAEADDVPVFQRDVVARDLAAAGLGTLKPERAISGVEGADPCPTSIKLEFSKETRDACPVFAARCVKGVANGPSPAWLRAAQPFCLMAAS